MTHWVAPLDEREPATSGAATRAAVDAAVEALAAARAASGTPWQRLAEELGLASPAIEELIHDEFDDAIMSPTNFRLDVQRRPDPEDDRVVDTLDGKFLAAQW